MACSTWIKEPGGRGRIDGVNADAIRASIDKGVLKVVVPKPAPAQVKKVEVKAA